MQSILRIAIISAVLALIGCSSDMGSGNDPSRSAASLNGLVLSPNPAVVSSSSPLTLFASGGIAPYHFSVVNASTSVCTISSATSNSAVISTGVSAGSCLISVTDSSTASAVSQVTVVAPSQQTTFSWQSGAFGACSATCGGGTQSRTVTCTTNTGVAAAESSCTATKPATSQACNTQACAPAYTWHGEIGRGPAAGQGWTYLGICSGTANGVACSSPNSYCFSPYDSSYSVYRCY